MKKITTLACALVALLGAADRADAQSVPTADNQAFVGSWAMAVDAMGQAVNLTIDIEDEGGQLAASVIGMAGTPTPVSRITRSDEALVLEYTADLQGQSAPISIRLTPAGDDLAGVLDVAGGMLTANGTATRK